MLPEGWKEAKVVDLCSFSNGRGFTPDQWDNVGLPIIRIQNLNGNANFNRFSGDVEPRFIIEKGQLLFAWAGTKGVSFGPTIWNGEKGILNQHIFKIHVHSGVDQKWLFSMLRLITDRIENKAHGFKASLVHVRKSEVEDQPVPLPPLPEQKKIADILSTWDAAIETSVKLLANAEAQKRALMQQLLTGKRRLKGFEGREWRVVSLKQATASIRDGTHGTHERHPVGVPMISAINVTADHRIDLASAPLISDADYAMIHKKYEIASGDVLVTVVGTLGRSALVRGEGKFTAQRSVAILRPSTECLPEFLAQVVQTIRFQRQLTLRANVTAQAGVYLGELAKIEVPLPALDEQRKISAVMDIWERFVSNFVTDLANLRSEKRALMQQLLTGKRRVTI